MTLPVITDLPALRQAQTDRRVQFALNRVSAAEANDDWRVRDGALQHKSGSFFSLTGYRDQAEGAEYLLLYQPQGAATGFATTVSDGQRHYLVQARAEPGNVDEVQFGPSLQSTPANYMRLHGGKTSPFARMFIEHDARVRVLRETQQLDQGKRYAYKTKRAAVLEIDPPDTLSTGFHWATADVLIDALSEDFLLNTDFTATIAISPWSANPHAGELCPRSELVCKSLTAPVRHDVLGQAAVQIATANKPTLNTVPIEHLANWRITDQGIEEVTPQQGWSVLFAHLKADAREVPEWTQPLIAAQDAGEAVLACRVKDDVLEVYVRTLSEVGLAYAMGLRPAFCGIRGKYCLCLTGFPRMWISHGYQSRHRTKADVFTIIAAAILWCRYQKIQSRLKVVFGCGYLN